MDAMKNLRDGRRGELPLLYLMAVQALTALFVTAANGGFAGCDRSILEVRQRSGKGRLKHIPNEVDASC